MIRLTIQRKVFIATFALATAMALLLLLFTRWNLEHGFERYTTAAEFARLDWLISNVEKEYAAHGNWDFVRENPRETWRRLQRRTNPGPGGQQQAPWQGGPPPWQGGPPPWEGGPPPWQGGPPPQENLRPPEPQGGIALPARDDVIPPPGARAGDVLSIGPRLALLDADGQVLAGSPEGSKAATRRNILYNGEVVGSLSLQPMARAASDLERSFLASQTRNLFLSGLAALALSLLAAWWLARHFLAPIRALIEGARKIASNQLETRISVNRDDEFGELAADFNSMAEQLRRAEESRKAWISDTSHELRTPLAVLRAELEALQDGIRDADGPTLERLLRQTHQLTKLVGDLRQTLEDETPATRLSMASIAPVVLLEQTAAAFGQRYADAGLAIDTRRLQDGGWQIQGDPDRLEQVFANVLENTLRYTDPGGVLRLRAFALGKRLVLELDDSAPAPPKTALPRLFERFYRAEASRSRAHGGSGLGLAICKAIVEAHGGTITAGLSDLGGLAIRIELPLENAP